MSVFRGGVTLDPIADALLKQVRQELGYKEKSGQTTKFGQWYADRVQDTQYRNAPWCDMFIAWAADKTGLGPYVGQFAWTPSHAAWFIKQNAWAQRPEPGALVFFDWGGGKSYKGVDHVGIVERVEGKKIHTIEANVDRVWLKRKVRDTDKVVGYGLPRVVKAAADQATEIRSTERPFVPAPRSDVGRSSPLDVLGTPPALLVAMVLVTVVLSLRVTGRRRGVHRRFGWLRFWNAPEGRGAARTRDDEEWAPPVNVPTPAPPPSREAAAIRVGTAPAAGPSTQARTSSSAALRQRAVRATAPEVPAPRDGRTGAAQVPANRRKPYTPKN
ncbi:CHAP domain-containing protein [Nonomuraea sp. NPDC001831]|uniref:CHAP domain-containing protein n=1 Tax=Nonomuraea sp. NPDC001831 TaxID=3364340 RepID=UPI00369B0988